MVYLNIFFKTAAAFDFYLIFLDEEWRFQLNCHISCTEQQIKEKKERQAQEKQQQLQKVKWLFFGPTYDSPILPDKLKK